MLDRPADFGTVSSLGELARQRGIRSGRKGVFRLMGSCQGVHVRRTRCNPGGTRGSRRSGVVGLTGRRICGPHQGKHALGTYADIAGLAAAYGFGLARNHPFNDGNKRIAFVTMAVSLGLNGYDIAAHETEVVTTMLDLAAELISEDALADWLRAHIIAS